MVISMAVRQLADGAENSVKAEVNITWGSFVGHPAWEYGLPLKLSVARIDPSFLSSDGQTPFGMTIKI